MESDPTNIWPSNSFPVNVAESSPQLASTQICAFALDAVNARETRSNPTARQYDVLVISTSVSVLCSGPLKALSVLAAVNKASFPTGQKVGNGFPPSPSNKPNPEGRWQASRNILPISGHGRRQEPGAMTCWVLLESKVSKK